MGKSLKQSHRPAKFSHSFLLKLAQKFGWIENFAPPTPLASVCLWLEQCTMNSWGASLRAVITGVTTGARGTIPRAANHYEGAELLRDAEKSQQCHKNFSAVHLLPKDLRFEIRGAKLASCPGHHLTSLRP